MEIEMTDIVRGEKAADNSILAVTLNKEYTVLLGEERHEVFFLHTAPEKKLGISKS
jgi:hypothetical protein